MARVAVAALLFAAAASAQRAPSPAPSPRTSTGAPAYVTRAGALPGPGPVYKASGRLAPFQADVFTISASPPTPGAPDPDIYVRVDPRQAGAPAVGLYCDPGYEDTGVEADRFPQPGSRVWEGEAFADGVSLTIARTDPAYRPPPSRAAASYSPSFVCAVVNQDATTAVQYR
jgi:hypothetical protein